MSDSNLPVPYLPPVRRTHPAAWLIAIAAAGIALGTLWLVIDGMKRQIARLENQVAADRFPLPSRAHHVAIQDLTAAIEGASDELEPLLIAIERDARMRAQARTRM